MPAGTPTATEPTLLARPAVLLEEDPDLGEGLDGTRREAALRDARTQAVVIPPGPWVQPEWPASIRSGAGLLILSGLLIRRVGLEHRHGAELLGAGDLLRPWQREDAASSLPRQAGWHVLERARIAILDARFLHRTCNYPELTGQLVARALRRSRALAVNMAIVHQPKVETRIHMLLWHLADRWGTVGPGGVHVPVRLTHAMLADLVAAQRPTVTAALGALEEAGLIGRGRGGWLLLGSQPVELAQVARATPDAS